MLRPDETTFVIQGLDADNRVVRAGVFVQKLQALLSALQLADKLSNGKKSYDFLLPDLAKGSASVTIRERQRAYGQPKSAIALLESTAGAIYNGDRNIDLVDKVLVERVRKIGEGVSKKFAHAELGFSGNNVIRIDDFLLRQAAAISAQDFVVPERKLLFSGRAIGSFDGVLKEIDARGTMLRGKLVLTAGGIEIDCVMNKEKVPEARNSFDRRVVVEGFAHYDGVEALPVRLDVHFIHEIEREPKLIHWKGAFEAPVLDDDGEDW